MRPLVLDTLRKEVTRQAHTALGGIPEPGRRDALGRSLAKPRGVRLTFDRGTVVIAQGGDTLDLATVPGVLWDARVGVHRVSPYRCAALVAEFRTKGVQVTDETTSYVRAADVAFSGPALRDYQETALQLWHAAGDRGAIVLPTGSGKTSVAIGAMARSRLPALCLVPTRVLLHQWRASLAQHYGGPIGVLGDGLRTIEAITVATFESAFRTMERIGNRFGLLVVDEVHHFGSGIRDEALEMCLAPTRLGLTATPPQGEAAARLIDLIGPKVDRLGVSDSSGRSILLQFWPSRITGDSRALQPESGRDGERSWWCVAFHHDRRRRLQGSARPIQRNQRFCMRSNRL
jgi:hypothetical protein